jgi:ribonucleotide reductase alpha subunit
VNWEKLREEIEQFGIKNTRVVAVMPLHPPARLMTVVTDGIEPCRDMYLERSDHPKSKYYGRSKK